MVTELASVCPDWLSIIKSDFGTLIKLNREVPVKQVVQVIRAKLQQQ
jgi:hypothetical protein